MGHWNQYTYLVSDGKRRILREMYLAGLDQNHIDEDGIAFSRNGMRQKHT